MVEQREFNEEVPAIINANEAHMACLLLLDTSGSMAGTAISELNSGLNRFKTEVCEDKTARDVLDIAIVEFNTNFNVIQDFVPIEYMQPVNLYANGGTNMAPAIEKAITMVDERSRFYRRTGSNPYKPWIVMVSDGFGGDISGVAEKIKTMEKDEKLNFFSLGVEGYDPKTLHELSGKKVMKLTGYDFASFFNWINKSMRSVSRSSPGEKPESVPLPENVDKDTSDWF